MSGVRLLMDYKKILNKNHDKRYKKNKNPRNINKYSNGNPYTQKEKREKLKNNAGSTFLRISIVRPRCEEYMKQEYIANGGYLPFKKPKFDNFILEFDNHQNSQPHFHIWRANGNSKISDTRSAGISLSSNVNTGLKYTYKERKKEAKLNDIQEEQIFGFLQENKLLLFCYYEAFMQGKVKQFPGLDEAFACSLFSDREFYRLAEKYKKLTGEIIPAEFGE